MKSFFQRFRERQERKNSEIELDRARAEAFEAGRNHAIVVARAERATAILDLLKATGGSPDEIAAAILESAAANKALHASHARNLEDIAAGTALVVRSEEN
jgi:hypothetical protein